MPEKKIYCSHCGSVNFSASCDPFLLHCASCHGITIVLSRDWRALPEGSPVQLPLPVLLGHQESEFSCPDCASTLLVEMILRAASEEPCPRCIDGGHSFGEQGEPIHYTPSPLSQEELLFLSGSSPLTH